MSRGTPLTGATILITGGASGLGRQLASRAAIRGARVVIWDLSAERGLAVADAIRSEGGSAEAFCVDVADRGSVQDAARLAGTVDILVNNAGIVSGQPLLEQSDDGIEHLMAVNVLALYWVTRAFLGGMVERGQGTIVTIASAAGLVGVSRQTDYSASKFAAFGFDESLRAEMRTRKTGVNTLVVCPYYIDTGMFEGVRTKYPRLLPILQEGEVADKVLDGIERGRKSIVLPPLVRLMPPLRILPVTAFDAVMDVFGVNQTMDHFTGRHDRGIGPDDPML